MLKNLSYLQFEVVAICVAAIVVALVVVGVVKLTEWMLGIEPTKASPKLPDDYTMSTHWLDGRKRTIPLNSRVNSNDVFDHARANAEDAAKEREIHHNKFDHLWHRGFRSSGGQFMSRKAWLAMNYQEQRAILVAKGSIRDGR